MAQELRTIRENEINLLGGSPDAGGFSDVHTGRWTNSSLHGTEKLAIKCFRKVPGRTDQDETEIMKTLKRRLDSEVGTWLKAQPHPNILPFRGVFYRGSEIFPALVSPFREAGNILHYIQKQNYNFDHRRISIGITSGIVHLHTYDIIHGDLKPNNILIHVDKDGNVTPEIADFGRARILNVKGYTASFHGMYRYTAPEVLQTSHLPGSPVIEAPEANKLLTKASDVWSLGMVLLHVISGVEPYPRLTEAQIVIALDRKTMPDPGEHKLAECPARGWIWPVLQRCWGFGMSPENRCTAEKCLELLRKPLETPQN